MNAVSTMKRNGARKMTAAAMSRLWLATARRNRLLRTPAGGFRRTKVPASTVALVISPLPQREPSGASCE